MYPLGTSVTTEQIETFDRDGVVPLHGVLPLGWVDELRAEMQTVFDRDLETNRDDFATGKSSSGGRADMARGVSKLLARGDERDLALEPGHKPKGRSIVETVDGLDHQPSRALRRLHHWRRKPTAWGPAFR